MSPNENFDRVYAEVCEKRGWTCSAGQVEVKLPGGRHQVVHLDFFEHADAQLVRLYTVIGSTKQIRPDRLRYALELNFGLPYGSFAVKDDKLVLVDTLMQADADFGELDACLAYLSETGDYYERSLFGPDSY